MSDDTTPPPGSERPRLQQHGPDRLRGLRASILAGPDVDLIDVSPGGILIESDVRMTPGAGICLSLTVDDQKHMVGGRISRVDAVLVKGGIRYRASVALDQELTIPASPAEEADSAATPESELPPAWPLAATADTEGMARLQAELDQLRRDRELQDHVLERLREAVLSGETLRKEVIDRQAAEQELWLQEQQALQERVLVAEAQAVDLSQQLAVAREQERRVALEHAQERARLETSVREYEQQLAELRATHEALTAGVDARREGFDRERAEWEARQAALASQLQATEGWCTDQQDLLYRVRQQMSHVFGLLYGAPPSDALIDAAGRAALQPARVPQADPAHESGAPPHGESPDEPRHPSGAEAGADGDVTLAPASAAA